MSHSPEHPAGPPPGPPAASRTAPARPPGTGVGAVFPSLVAVFLVSGALLWTVVDGSAPRVATGLAVFAFTVSGWVVSLCLHEYAHARAALWAGDRTVRDRGYLTLDPRRYANPMLSVVLPVLFVVAGGIALPGGSVTVDRARIPGRLRHSLVSAAGPAVNLLFAVLLLAPLASDALRTRVMPGQFTVALALLGMFQVTAVLLNLLPVPGLDGYGIAEPWLPARLRARLAPFAAWGMLAVFALLWVPAVNRWFFGLVDGVLSWFSVPGWYVDAGLTLFRFWQQSW